MRNLPPIEKFSSSAAINNSVSVTFILALKPYSSPHISNQIKCLNSSGYFFFFTITYLTIRPKFSFSYISLFFLPTNVVLTNSYLFFLSLSTNRILPKSIGTFNIAKHCFKIGYFPQTDHLGQNGLNI